MRSLSLRNQAANMADRVYATVEQLESRWRSLSSSEKDTAEVLLGDASALLRSFCRSLDSDIADGSVEPVVVEAIVCAMVRRSMNVSDDGFGVSSFQESAGPFSMSRSFASPTGDMYVTTSEKQRLRCGGMRVYTIDTVPKRFDRHPFLEDSS